MFSRFRFFALTLLLAACGGNEAAHPVDARLLAQPAQVGILVQPAAGLPATAANELAGSLANALQGLGYPASTRASNPASYLLVGNVGGRAPNGQTQLAIELRTPQGQMVTRHVVGLRAEEVSASARQVDWAALAGDLAAGIDSQLAQRDLRAVAVARPPVAVGTITGINEAGARDLAAALRYELGRARERVVDQPAPNGLVIDGAITMTRPNRANVNFTVVWTVRRGDGRFLGQARQANSIPVTALERSWGQVALGIASGAAEGIADVINRSPNTP